MVATPWGEAEGRARPLRDGLEVLTPEYETAPASPASTACRCSRSTRPCTTGRDGFAGCAGPSSPASPRWPARSDRTKLQTTRPAASLRSVVALPRCAMRRLPRRRPPAQPRAPRPAHRTPPPTADDFSAARADYLTWWLRRSHLPPILAAGVPGPAGTASPMAIRAWRRGTGPLHGRALRVEWDGPAVGVEAGVLLERDSAYGTMKPIASPQLAYLYTDANTGQQASEVIAGNSARRGPLTGGFVGYSRIEFFGKKATSSCRSRQADGGSATAGSGTVPAVARPLPWDRHEHRRGTIAQLRCRGRRCSKIATTSAATRRSTRRRSGCAGKHRAYGRFFVNGGLTRGHAGRQESQPWGEPIDQTPRRPSPSRRGCTCSQRLRRQPLTFDAAGEVAWNVSYRLASWADVSVGYTFLLWGDTLRLDRPDRHGGQSGAGQWRAACVPACRSRAKRSGRRA